MRINKSQVRAAIRFAKVAHDEGRDAVAALNEKVREFGVGGSVTTGQAQSLQAAYRTGGEGAAVESAIAMLRQYGVTVVDDESGTTSDLFATMVAADDVAAEPVVSTGSVEAYATGLADALFEGGRQAGVRYLAEVAGVKGLTVTTEQVTEIVTNFAEALKDEGIEYATESLQEAYDALRNPAATTTDVGLEGRVARLEQIARAQGLL